MALYVKIEGIDGDVTHSGYEKWIEANECDFGLGRSVSTRQGSTKNRTASAASVSEVVITKFLDAASPKLLLEAAQGQEGKTVSIHAVDGGSDRKFVEYTLTNTLLSSYAVRTKGERPQETLSFNFTEIECKVTPYNEDNKPGSPVTVKYDLTAATGG